MVNNSYICRIGIKLLIGKDIKALIYPSLRCNFGFIINKITVQF